MGKVDSSGTSTYKRDGAGVLAPVLSDGTTAMTQGISSRVSSTTTFDHHDYLGTTSLQTAGNESTVSTRTYDAFGMPISTSGTPKTGFGFAGGYGYQEDADSGLKLLGHRYYDASTGRFLTRDPAKDGRSWYGYCENDPLKFVDPVGYKSGWIKSAWKWIKKTGGRVSGGIKGIGRGTWKVIGVVTVVRPVASFFEVLYEGAINSQERL